MSERACLEGSSGESVNFSRVFLASLDLGLMEDGEDEGGEESFEDCFEFGG